jgi:hypothetical protein
MATDVAPASDPSRPVHEGDELFAADDAVAEVEHFDGSLTRLDAGGTAHLGRLADADGRPHVVLRLEAGNSWHRASGADHRHGQYEAHTPSAVAVARTATFVVRSHDDGAAWFGVLAGSLVVRGARGGTVVLHAGETVAAGPAGAMSEVGRVGVETLAQDPWVAVNARLDDVPYVEPAPEPEAPAPEPEPAVLGGGIDAIASIPPPRTAEETGGHPWRIGIAAVVAIGLGVFSVVIGRSAATPSNDDNESEPTAAAPAPPAAAGPVVTMPTPTTVPSAPAHQVTARSCVRRHGAVDYNATIRNDDTVGRDYRVRVHFVDGANRTVATAETDVLDVPAGGTRHFHVVGRGEGIRAATDCEVGAVTVL